MTQPNSSIVITGASSGIGRATALRLARSGWRVFAAVRKSRDAQHLKEEFPSIRTILMDVCDQSSIANAVAEVTALLGESGLDALFNNAGVGAVSPVEYTALSSLREIYEINLFGQIAVIQAFLPLLRLARGRIINTGSVADHIAPPFAGALASSKAAFASMSAALRLELRAQGIHVSIVEPGAISTPAADKTLGGIEKTISTWPPEGAALYANAIRRMVRTFAMKEQQGSPADAVARVVERALSDRHPRTRYPAGKDARKLSMLARFLPEKLLDITILKTFGVSAAELNKSAS